VVRFAGSVFGKYPLCLGLVLFVILVGGWRDYQDLDAQFGKTWHPFRKAVFTRDLSRLGSMIRFPLSVGGSLSGKAADSVMNRQQFESAFDTLFTVELRLALIRDRLTLVRERPDGGYLIYVNTGEERGHKLCLLFTPVGRSDFVLTGLYRP
jgi:hypothetical protein